MVKAPLFKPQEAFVITALILGEFALEISNSSVIIQPTSSVIETVYSCPTKLLNTFEF